MKVYLDNCCFNRPFDSQADLRVRLECEAKLAIQSFILEKKVSLVWSYVLDLENYANPFLERRSAIARWRAHAVTDIDESEDVLDAARQLTGLGVKSKDALHLACALVAECDVFFTTDDLILKKMRNRNEIKVLNPVDYILEMEQ